MAEWSRIVNTTISKYIKGAEQQVLRNRKLLALMQQKGKISFNNAGKDVDWKVRYRQAPIQGYADTDTLTFSRRDRWKTAVLDWRGYATTDSMTKAERLKNTGVEAIVKVYDEIAQNMMEDMEEQFGDELYIDGNAAANLKKLHGIESFMSTSGAGTKQPVGLPNDTYAGLVCTLGNYGGSWSSTGSTAATTGDWPGGRGDSHYDFWAPLVVDYTSAVATSTSAGTRGWAASTKTWPNTCLEALRYGIIRGKKNKSKRGMLDLILLHDDLYIDFLNKLQAEENIHVYKGKDSPLYSLGFTDVITFDGVDVTYEYGIPQNVGYGWSMDNLELMSQQSQLFVPEGPDWDIATQSWRFSIDFFGNLKFKSTRYFTKWAAIS